MTRINDPFGLQACDRRRGDWLALVDPDPPKTCEHCNVGVPKLASIPTRPGDWRIAALARGETIVSKEPGNSMTPILKSRQPCRIAPATWEEVEVGDIVLCKVRGNMYTHKVTAKNPKRGVQISNNKNYVNGWTKRVFGKVIEILSME